MSPAEAANWVSEAGLVGVLVVIILAWLRGWVHSHREFEAQQKETRWWRQMAIRALDLGEAAVNGRGTPTTVEEEDDEGG